MIQIGGNIKSALQLSSFTFAAEVRTERVGSEFRSYLGGINSALQLSDFILITLGIQSKPKRTKQDYNFG